MYGCLCGIYTSRKLEEACRYHMDFLWLLGEEKAPDHSTLARFRTGRCRDARTLRPFLQRSERFQQARYKEVVADAGYESMDNYVYLDSTGQSCFIRPGNYDQKKSRKFQKQIGRIENMACDLGDDSFT